MATEVHDEALHQQQQQQHHHHHHQQPEADFSIPQHELLLHALASCHGCGRSIQTNLIFDEGTMSDWHAECYELRRMFMEDEDVTSSSTNDVQQQDIERIVAYWRTNYFDLNEEYQHVKNDFSKLERQFEAVLAAGRSSKAGGELDAVDSPSMPRALAKSDSSHSIKAAVEESEDNRLTAHERLIEHIQQEQAFLEQKLALSEQRCAEEQKKHAAVQSVNRDLSEQLVKAKAEEDRLWTLLEAADLDTTELTNKLTVAEQRLSVSLPDGVQIDPAGSGSTTEHHQSLASALAAQQAKDAATIVELKAKVAQLEKSLAAGATASTVPPAAVPVVVNPHVSASPKVRPQSQDSFSDISNRLSQSLALSSEDVAGQADDLERKSTKHRRMSMIGIMTGQHLTTSDLQKPGQGVPQHPPHAVDGSGSSSADTPSTVARAQSIAPQKEVKGLAPPSSSGVVFPPSPERTGQRSDTFGRKQAKQSATIQRRQISAADGRKVKNSPWQTVYCVLKGASLYFYASEKASHEKSLLDSIRLPGAIVEYTKDDKKANILAGTPTHSISLKTETEGEYWLDFGADASDNWLAVLKELAVVDASSLAHARRSHCIPHRFKDETFILHTTKCNMCNTAIQMKGLRCVHCEYSCHHKCSSKAPPNCGLADLTTIITAVETRPKNKSDLKSLKLTFTRRKKDAAIESPTATIGKSFTNEFTKSVASMGSDTFGIQLNDFPGSEDEVPFIVTECIHAVEKRGLDIEGLYRLSGVKGDIEKLRMHFSYGRPNLSDDDLWNDVHVITGVLKLWLRQLPDPLISSNLFAEFTKIGGNKAAAEDARIAEIQKLLPRLSVKHLTTLRSIIGHLARVSAQGASNKMFASNLGAVFGPTLLRSPDDTIALLAAQCSVVELMIKGNTVLFPTAA